MSDRFEAEGVTLICGDCHELLAECPAVDAVVIDPPFGIGFAAQPTDYQRKNGMKPENWDDDPILNIESLLAVGDIQVVWGGNYYALPQSRGWLSWFKPDAPPSMGSFELAWTNQDQNCRQISRSIAATNAERVGHPTQKPVAVISWCMDRVGIPEGAMVADFFSGSGTTAISCIRSGRRFWGCERDPKHFATAVARIQRELAQPRFDFTPKPVMEQPSMF